MPQRLALRRISCKNFPLSEAQMQPGSPFCIDTASMRNCTLPSLVFCFNQPGNFSAMQLRKSLAPATSVASRIRDKCSERNASFFFQGILRERVKGKGPVLLLLIHPRLSSTMRQFLQIRND